MRLSINRHEDERRTLREWLSDIPVKRCKVIETKKKSILGNHYHNNSDSVFFMMKGKARYELKPNREGAKVDMGWMFEDDCIFVPRGVIHTFEVWDNSILLEAASEPYNKEDEIQITK